jgi:hypothetical protein
MDLLLMKQFQQGYCQWSLLSVNNGLRYAKCSCHGIALRRSLATLDSGYSDGFTSNEAVLARVLSVESSKRQWFALCEVQR